MARASRRLPAHGGLVGAAARCDAGRGEGEPEALRRARARRLGAGLRDVPAVPVVRGRRRRRRGSRCRRRSARRRQATAEIWRFVLDIDWYATLEASLLPLDHPLFLLLATPRRMKFRVSDSLWVRLVDVGAALSGRAVRGRRQRRASRCTTPCARGTRAAGSSRAARRRARRSRRSSRSASTRSGRRISGPCRSPSSASAGRVEELADGAIQRADALFAWRPLPWCPEIF